MQNPQFHNPLFRFFSPQEFHTVVNHTKIHLQVNWDPRFLAEWDNLLVQMSFHTCPNKQTIRPNDLWSRPNKHGEPRDKMLLQFWNGVLEFKNEADKAKH